MLSIKPLLELSILHLFPHFVWKLLFYEDLAYILVMTSQACDTVNIQFLFLYFKSSKEILTQP